MIDSGACAAAVLSSPPRSPLTDRDEVRIALDGDAVLFSEDSEVIFQMEGLEEFHKREDNSQDDPLPEGPYADFLKKLAQMQERLPGRVEYSPVRLALVTARNSPAELRVIKTLRKWGVYVDMAFFMGGVRKTEVLRALNPHIFFDDQDRPIEAVKGYIPTGKVLYRSDSELRALLEERDRSSA